MGETMDWAEHTALRILSEHNGSKLFEPFVAALRSAREEERKRAADVARTCGLTLQVFDCTDSGVVIDVGEAQEQIARAIESGSEKAG